MAKHLSLIILWSVLIAGSLGLRSVGRMHADPTDDFSFTLAHVPALDTYRLMPERRVTEILEDRLDLVPKSEAPRLARHLLSLCKRYRFDPAFVLALIHVESSFRVRAVSPYGAVGLMQVMPATALGTLRQLGVDTVSSREDAGRLLMDPYANLSLGIAYLSWLRDKYRGLSTYFLVAAYNVGPGRMDELRSKKDFKPVTTKRYFEAIRREISGFRYYRREA